MKQYFQHILGGKSVQAPKYFTELVVVVTFFLAQKDSGRLFGNSFPLFFKRRSACAHLFHSLRQDQSTVTQ